MTGKPITAITWREWRSFILQVCLVVGIELSDDITRGFFFHRPVGPAQENALRVMQFEQSHGFWIEPGLQRFFEQPHHLLGMLIAWPQVVDVVNSLYGLAHGLITCLVALWVFWRRRSLFPFVRNVFLISTAMSVAVYNIFPTAPPRLAIGLRYDG
ncbi:MAG TPA: phosphatase PAP2 family protein, partial [Chloroflexota bacterium]|nr:phosphatase PAP2 family protein [Chloroflexota bacterium]